MLASYGIELPVSLKASNAKSKFRIFGLQQQLNHRQCLSSFCRLAAFSIECIDVLVEIYTRYAHLPCVIQSRVIEEVIKV